MADEIVIELTQPQWEFLNLKNKFGLLSGGVGSGKSHAGALWSRCKISDEPETAGLIGANTYKQLNSVTLSKFFSILEEQKIRYMYKENKGLCYVGGRKIHCVSLENYAPIRGIEIGWFWIDETRDTRAEAWEVLIARLRCKKAKKLEGRATSTPSGYDWVFDRFNPSGELHTPEYKMVTATSYSNRNNLPTGFIETLESSYDKMMFRQEVMGEMLNIQAGRIYYAFDRNRHVKECKYRPGYPIWVGMDFNVNPMTAVVIQNILGKIRVVDEFWLMTSNARDMGMHIQRKYGDPSIINIVPDSTGTALHSSGVGLSSHEQLRDLGFNVIYHSNPFRMDRYNCVNNLFEKDSIEIDPSCKHFINDLEKCLYKKGTTQADTNDKMLTHISDGFGYYCWYHFPLIRPTSGAYSLPR